MTKERLRNYRALKRELKQIEERLVSVEAALYSPKIQKLTGMPAGGSHEGSALEAMATQHMELRDHYARKMVELTAELLSIETAIDALSVTERTLLRFRYIEGLTWEEVCVAMSYSWRQIHYLHNRALTHLTQK